MAIALVLGALSVGCATKPKFSWGEFPAGSSPREKGNKMVANLISRPIIEARDYGVIYPEVCASYGSFRFVDATDDKALFNQLIDRYDGMLNPNPPAGVSTPRASAPPAASAPAEGGARQGGRRGGRGGGGGNIQSITVTGSYAGNMIPVANHVDRSVFGTLPLEIYRHNKDAKYLAIGKKSADDQWGNPTADGLTDQTRWWIDDMFMITALQSAAYRATGDKVYLDRAANEMAAYLDKLQQPNGLFHHADDVPIFWGRGVGWVAAGLTELLSIMPEKHPKRARILEGYQKMMAGLLANQAPDGMWRQLLDKPESWPETSCTGMFVFAMASGVKNGWLDEKTYKEPAKKAWIALAGYLTEDGNVREVCAGTNKLNDIQYYLDRPRRVGDLHGQAAFIWASWAMLD